MSDPRPIIFLDVDGVLSPMAGADEAVAGFARITTPSGESCVLNLAHGPALLELARRADLAWATTWGDAANQLQGPILGLPHLPVAAERRPKLPELLRYAGDRPFAWLDDDVSQMDTYRLAERNRLIPTLLIRVDARRGLSEVDLSGLRAFLERLG